MNLDNKLFQINYVIIKYLIIIFTFEIIISDKIK
jgi:hypothetical protein